MTRMERSRRKRFRMILVLSTVVLLVASCIAAGQTNLVYNPGFEVRSGNIPIGWSVFSGAQYIFVETEGTRSGERVLVFRDASDSVSVDLRSMPVSAKAGET